MKILSQAREKWGRGYSLANISRHLNIRYEALEFLVIEPSQSANIEHKSETFDPIKGYIPQKVPGSYGVPLGLIMKGQCQFPLWGDAEKPTVLSLMCGEPIGDQTGCYCLFHHKLCHCSESETSI